MLFIFVFIPLIQNFIYSFYDFSAFSPTKTFVGLDNFKELFQDKVVGTALINIERNRIRGGSCNSNKKDIALYGTSVL